MIDLRHGDCLDILRELPDNSVDAVVTDPPYGLEFMGKEWDGADGFRRSLNPNDAGRDNAFGRTSRTSPEYRTASKAQANREQRGGVSGANGRPTFLGGLNPKCLVCDKWQRGANPCRCEAPEWTQERLVRLHSFQEWCEAWARECLRVLKPGGHMLAFGGTRTFHRLACAVEDSGFEIRDSLAWLYGSGFPKSLNLVDDQGERTGWGTALKPAFEPVVVARKPLGGSVNIQARVEYELRRRGVEGEIRWTTRPASDVESPSPTPTSGSTAPPRTGATSAETASASATPLTASATASDTERSPDSGEPPTSSTPAPTSERPTANSGKPSSTPTDQTAPAVASPTRRSSRSTTSTEAAPSTASRSTGRSTPSSDAKDSRPATESFAGIATGLIGSATVLIERRADGSFVWPDDLPAVVSGGSTVAANVLAHGTGALNIDGCRVGDEVLPEMTAGQARIGTFERGVMVTPERTGRWPANVVLDESQAAALDEQSGETVSKSGGDGGTFFGEKLSGKEGDLRQARREGHDDIGGASRFFYVAKADASERVRVPRKVLRLRSDLTPEQVDHVTARLREAGVPGV